MSLVVFKDLTLKYSGNAKATLNEISLEIEEGEFIVVVGPSGCGKTTTLKVLSGLEDITSGELFIDGKLVNFKEPKDRNISMVFQNYALYPHFTVEKNISFGLKKSKLAKEDIKTKVEKVSKMLGIEDQMKKMPKDLSGGQQQRVALARAIVREPLIYIFDEPLSNLDAKLRTKTREEIVQMHNALKKTFFYVTHDQIEAMTMADRIIVLKDGVVQQFDRPINIFYNPSNLFVAKFMGTPEMNTFIASVKDNKATIKDGVYVSLSKTSANIVGDNTSIHLGIRPDEIDYSFTQKQDYQQVQIIGREILGNTTLVNCQTGTERINVMVKTKEYIESNSELFILINSDSCYYFDIDTEKNLNANY